jgi:hypothetical protein
MNIHQTSSQPIKTKKKKIFLPQMRFYRRGRSWRRSWLPLMNTREIVLPRPRMAPFTEDKEKAKTSAVDSDRP